MRIVIISQDDPFYVREFFPRFLKEAKKAQIHVLSVVLLKPFDESPIDNASRLIQFYGPVHFIKLGIQYLVFVLMDRFKLGQRSILRISEAHNVPTQKAKNVNSPSLISKLRDLSPDVILSVSAPQIFKKELLETPKWGCVNIHSSQLPKYRGMLPNFWAMYHGESSAGITVHKMDTEIDRGKIILRGSVPIHTEQTLASLMKNSKREAADLAVRALKKIRDGKVQLQDFDGKSSYFSFPKRVHAKHLLEKGHRLL